MKIKLIIIKLVVIVFAFTGQYAIACSFDTDCAIGSSCIKNGGLYGYCAGGMNPGNSYDRQPATDLRGGAGWTCSFNTDCDPGYFCAKSGLKGVCLKN